MKYGHYYMIYIALFMLVPQIYFGVHVSAITGVLYGIGFLAGLAWKPVSAYFGE